MVTDSCDHLTICCWYLSLRLHHRQYSDPVYQRSGAIERFGSSGLEFSQHLLSKYGKWGGVFQHLETPSYFNHIRTFY